MSNRSTVTPPDADKWPNSVGTRAALDAALAEGFVSGRSPKTHDEIIAETRQALNIHNK